MKIKATITERRKFFRLPVEIRVKFKPLDSVIDTKGLKPAKSKDISTGGILFHSTVKMAPGTALQMKIDFTRGKSKYDLAAIGQVIRCDKLKGGQYNVGVKFLEIYPDDLNLLKGYIETKVKKIL
jgi:c-di-GMP-binding flagellar brake protein YcgR